MNPVGLDDAEPIPRNGNNHFFHFNGSRYVSWLPNFSVEVTHINDLLRRDSVIHQQNHTSQMRTMARQVQEMFPRIPMQLILNDLQQSHSIESTIDNILENRLTVPTTAQFQNDGSEPSTSHVAPGQFVNMNQNEYFADAATPDTRSGNASPTSSTGSGYEVERTNNVFGITHDLLREDSKEEVVDRFSQSSEEREKFLQLRKDQLLVNARKRYLKKII